MRGCEEGELVCAVAGGFGVWVECVARNDDGAAVRCAAAGLRYAAGKLLGVAEESCEVFGSGLFD